MQIKKILWASDGSKESRDALRWAELCATRLGASVSALSVIESPDLCTLEVPDGLKAEISLIDRELGTREAKRLRRLGTVLEQKGIKAGTRVVRGIPYQEIIKAAQSHDVDMIAMGKRGLNLWGRMLLGEHDDQGLTGIACPDLNRAAGSEKARCEENPCPQQLFAR